MHYERSGFLSRCVTYSISDPRGVSPDCKMCVRVTKRISLGTIYCRDIFYLAESLNGQTET